MDFYLPDVQYFCLPVLMSILGRLYSLPDARKNSGLLRSGYVKPYACDTRVMFLLLTGWSRMNCASGLCRAVLKTVLLAGALLPKLSTPCAVAESASGVPFQALHSNEAVRITVLDPAGALVPDADVTVTCVGRTGATTSHRTNHFGNCSCGICFGAIMKSASTNRALLHTDEKSVCDAATSSISDPVKTANT